MKIAVIGATGRAGSRIITEAARRGHAIVAVPRTVDVNDETSMAQALRGADTVVSAVKFVVANPQKLIEAVRRSGVKRYVVVGGAGSLSVAPGRALVDEPDFPAAYRDEALRGRAFLEALRDAPDLDWTFISPSAMMEPGERTGTFRTGGDTLLVDDHGNSAISMEDYAIALVNEVEHPAHVRQRFTVGY